MVKTSPSNAAGLGSIPGWGAKIPHALGPKNQNIKQRQYCNKFNKGFKNGPHLKNLKKKKKERKKESQRSLKNLLLGQGYKVTFKKLAGWEFPGGPMVSAMHFHCRGERVQSLLRGPKIPQASQHGQKKKKISWVNKLRIINLNFVFFMFIF